MPRNDGGALPGEEEGAPQEILFDNGGMLFAGQAGTYRMDQAAAVLGRQLRNLGVTFGWDPGYTAEAEETAEKAFRNTLTPAQRRTWTQHHWFVLRSNRGHWWRIRGNGVSGNVDLLSGEKGVPLAAFCAHPAGTMPYPSIYLAQLYTLTHDEARFTKVAICHWGYPIPDGLQIAAGVLALLPPRIPWVNTPIPVDGT